MVKQLIILLWILPATSGIFKDQNNKQVKRPLVVFVTGDHEYSSEATMPLLAKELEKNYGMRVKVLKSLPDQDAEENIPGLEVLNPW